MTGWIEPRHFGPDDGRTYRFGRMTLRFKTTSGDNSGAYSLCEAIEPPGSGARLHRHLTFDETHIICEGQYDFQLGERRLKLGPGDIVSVPKGTPHSIQCIGPAAGRELMISSPGGIFDAFIHEVVTRPLRSGNLLPGDAPLGLRGIAAKYGIEFIDD